MCWVCPKEQWVSSWVNQNLGISLQRRVEIHTERCMPGPMMTMPSCYSSLSSHGKENWSGQCLAHHLFCIVSTNILFVTCCKSNNYIFCDYNRRTPPQSPYKWSIIHNEGQFLSFWGFNMYNFLPLVQHNNMLNLPSQWVSHNCYN